MLPKQRRKDVEVDKETDAEAEANEPLAIPLVDWLSVSAVISSFYSKYDNDDDGRHHQNKNVTVLTI